MALEWDHKKFSNKQLLEKRTKYHYPTPTMYYQEPFRPVKARGCRVWDESGKEYLDAIGGIVTISIGHNHPKVKAQMKKMLDDDAIQHTTSLYLSMYLEELVEKLASVAPKGLQRCYVTNSGSEANEMAVLTARVSTGEQMIVALRHAYHGGTNVTLGLCGHNTWKFRAQPQASIVHAMEPYCYRCPFGKTRTSCSLECAEDIKKTIETTTSGKIAGFIAEPIMGVGGFVDPPVEYFKRAHEIVKSFGGRYISDEVQTGVGRTGKNFFAIQDAGVTPDIVTMAKGIGNGAPVGAVIANDECAEAIRGKIHFNTYGGDPYQAMQAATVIDVIAEEKLIQNADTMGRYLREGFIDLQRDFTFIGDIRGRGLMVGLELVKDVTTKEFASQEAARLMDLAKNHGLLVGKGGLRGNVIRIAPPLSITKSDCDELLKKMKLALTDLRKECFQ